MRIVKLRQALRVLLEQADQVQIVGEVADAPGLLARLEGAAAELVLLDWDLPGLAMAIAGIAIDSLRKLRLGLDSQQKPQLAQ